MYYGAGKAIGAVRDGIRRRQSNSQVRYRIGKQIEPMYRTYQMALEPELYAQEVTKKYGISKKFS